MNQQGAASAEAQRTHTCFLISEQLWIAAPNVSDIMATSLCSSPCVLTAAAEDLPEINPIAVLYEKMRGTRCRPPSPISVFLIYSPSVTLLTDKQQLRVLEGKEKYVGFKFCLCVSWI